MAISQEPNAFATCLDCHSGNSPDGEILIKESDALRGLSGDELDRVYRALVDERMPPREADSLSGTHRSDLIDRVLNEFQFREYSPQPVATRRMTIGEFRNSLRSIFNVDAEFSLGLPPDPVSVAGYDNSSELLTFSSLQIEAYLDAARDAVTRYVDWGTKNEKPLRYLIEFEDLFYANADRYKSRDMAPAPFEGITEVSNVEPVPVFGPPLAPRLPGAFSDDEQLRAAIPKLNQQYVALKQRYASGEILISVRASGTPDRLGRYPRMRVEAGITLGDGCSMDKRVLGEVDVKASLKSPGTYQFRARLEDIPTKGQLKDGTTFDRLSVFDMDQIFISNITPDSNALFGKGPGGYSSPEEGRKKTRASIDAMRKAGTNFLHLDKLVVEMFPGPGASTKQFKWRMPELTGDNAISSTELRQFLQRFMREAYRRPVAEDELQRRIALFEKLRSSSTSAVAMRDTLAAILISPGHLLLEKPSQTNNSNYELASQLSFAIWRSPPDSDLLRMAATADFADPEIREQQIRRMLEEPQFQNWTRDFCYQWLGLSRLDRTAVSREVYPFWDDDLKRELLNETLSTFDYVVQHDRSCLELLKADYAFVNDRLSQHYGLPAVNHGDLKRSTLPKGSARGGLLGHGSLLCMNSDGDSSHPIRRGVWILDRLFANRPPPPPPNVPELEATAQELGKTSSLLEKIERHRASEACSSCHETIDPWGLALEQFDATGRFHPLNSPETRTGITLPSGQEITGFASLRKYITNHQSDRFARGLVHHVITYLIGREPDFRDRLQVIEIEKRFKHSDYKLKELILAVLNSPIFLNP